MSLVKTCIGTLLLTGALFAQNTHTLEDFDELRQTCLSGNGDNCSTLSSLFFTGDKNTLSDKYEAIKYSKIGCKFKSSEGCFQLAVGFISGDALPRDNKRSQKYMKKACSLGLTKACAKILPKS